VHPLEPPDAPDPVVEAYKSGVDRTLFERNLRLTPTERVEQLQRFVRFLAEAAAARARTTDRVLDRQAD
jgi:hypothetical protein